MHVAPAYSHLPQPDLEPIPDCGLYRYVTDYHLTLPGCGRHLIVRAGFTTDGASIPRLFWPLVGSPFDPDFIAPCAGGHDPLYAAELLPRRQCDAEMRLLMLANGATANSKADLFAFAVRVGGWATWRKHTARTIQQARQFVFLI